MAKKKQKGILKGSRFWAMSHAVSSLRTQKVRNIGIALILAICVAIPTTVFAWTNTGTRLAVEDFLGKNPYQLSVIDLASDRNYDDLLAIEDWMVASPFIEQARITPSTVGILRIAGVTTEWDEYRLNDRVYASGIKDMRVIVVTQEILNEWSTELVWSGNTTIDSDQILVSQQFITSAEEVTNYTLEIGSEISIDILRNYYNPDPRVPFDPLPLDRLILGNLTIAGIYDVTSLSVVSQSYPSISRQNWDALESPSSVLGLDDSVLILDESLDQESIEKITADGYFSPVEFFRGSTNGLVSAGPSNAAFNLLSLKTQIQEYNIELHVIGEALIEDLQTYISTYLASQVLIILAIPIMIMSLMLTLFTSETSVSQKKGEVSALRAKGASFNQIFSSFIYESLILTGIGYVLGLILTIFMAPLVGSSTGLLSFDPALYSVYFAKLLIPEQSLALAVAIAMFLPATYLVHVARRIDVTEIGQPTTRMTYEIPEEANIWYYVVALGGTLLILLVMPMLINPIGQIALIQILVSALLLFTASYLGSRAMRLVTAIASERVGGLIGEKKLYMTQSLRRRKSQFIPLLVILTLTLTTTSMMLIQTASFQDTLQNEAVYALGCDVRIEKHDQSFDWIDTLTSYSGVESATPVLELLSYVGWEGFYLEGIDAAAYLEIGLFKESSFVGASPETALNALESTPNGIIISQYYAMDWNLTTGDILTIEVPRSVGGDTSELFQVVGVMVSAPCFGMASTRDLQGVPFGTYFGFQPGSGGFAFVNIDYLSIQSGYDTADLFLVDATSIDEIQSMLDFLQTDQYTEFYTPENLEFGSNTVTGLFIAGIEGLTMISFIMCASMGIAAIVLFLGSAVLEREPEYALFRAIGGTKRQVISLVFGEFAGSVIAAVLISLGLGVLFGYSMTLLTFGISSVWPILPKVFTYPLTVMFLTVALECIAMIAACYFPARRAGNTDPADVLRNM
ncbi:MAG: FtsX-like permease family protein [Candidatus Thorarchaeota archaeon]